MGILSRLTGGSKPQGPPPAGNGDPFVAKIKAGSGFELGLNLKHISDGAVRQLAGRMKDDDEEIERSVRLVMFRDYESQYPDSVKVVTADGDLVGWLLKDVSGTACEVLDAITVSIRGQVKGAKDRPIHLDVSAEVEGSWYDDEDDDGNEVWLPSIDSVTVRMKNPVEVDART